MYHDSAWSQGAQGLWQNPPFFAEGDVFQFGGCPVLLHPAVSLPAVRAAPEPASPSGFQMDFRLSPRRRFPPSQERFITSHGTSGPGKVAQWNVNVERQLPGNIVLTVGYAGSHGNHILISGNALDTNGPSGCVAGGTYTLGCAPGGAPFVSPFTPPGFNAILEFGDIGKTTYNSLQIKAETKSARYGLYALFAYTYSHTYDNG